MSNRPLVECKPHGLISCGACLDAAMEPYYDSIQPPSALAAALIAESEDGTIRSLFEPLRDDREPVDLDDAHYFNNPLASG